MRILHTIYDDVKNPWCGGGGAIRAFEIDRRLAEKHDITLLSGNYPGAAAEEVREGIRIRRVGTVRSYAASRLSFSVLASYILMKERFDLWVYGFSAFAPLLAPAALRRRSVLEFFHRMGGHAVRKHPLAGLPALIAERYVLGAYPHIISISPSVSREIVRISGKHGLHLVYTGVDRSCFEVRASEQDYILYFGRLDIYNKGIDLLLKAFAQVLTLDFHVRLVVAGRGDPIQQKALEAMCDALSIKKGRVVFTGPVSDDRRAELFGGALFTCMPSRYEGWGITAIEAGAAGKAVIGTEIPGLSDAIRHGETGLLVPPENVEALAEGMRKLLEEPQMRQRLGRAGRCWARQFTWDRIARDQERVYEQVVERCT